MEKVTLLESSLKNEKEANDSLSSQINEMKVREQGLTVEKNQKQQEAEFYKAQFENAQTVGGKVDSEKY